MPQIRATTTKAQSRRGRAAFAKISVNVLLELGVHHPLAKKKEREVCRAAQLPLDIAATRQPNARGAGARVSLAASAAATGFDRDRVRRHHHLPVCGSRNVEEQQECWEESPQEGLPHEIRMM